jgi:hypothetical protein
LFNIVADLVNLSFTATQSGTYKIAGTYCEPEVYIPERENTIQFLAHPATYDRSYVSLFRKFPPEDAHLFLSADPP